MIIATAAIAASLMPVTAATSAQQQAEVPSAGYADPPVRFAPFAVKVSFRVSAGRVVRDCTVELFGDPDPHWRDNACPNIAQFLELIGVDGQLEGRMTALLTLTADGRTVESGAAAGRLIFRTGARFELGASGAIAACQPDAQLGNGNRLNLCPGAFPRGGNPFEAGTEGRRGLLSLDFYLER